MTDEVRVEIENGHYKIVGLPKRLAQRSQELFDVSLTRGLSTKTVKAYAYDLTIFFRWHLRRGQPFSKLDQKTLIQFLKYQRQTKNRMPSTVNRQINSIQIFYRFCFGRKISGVLENEQTQRFLTFDRTLGIYPIYTKRSSILRVRVPETIIRPLEPNEVAKFFKSISSYRNRSIVSLMLFCGLRSEEVISIRLTDIDHTAKTFLVRGKGKRERTLPLPGFLDEAINRYISFERPQTKSDYLFLSLKGKNFGQPLSVAGLRSQFRTIRKNSGIKRANPHRFRHTFGRDLAMAGVSQRAIQELFGHKDFRTSVKYSQLNIKDVYEDHAKALSRQKNLYDSSAT